MKEGSHHWRYGENFTKKITLVKYKLSRYAFFAEKCIPLMNSTL
jgi:hypothetical protein